MFRAKIGKEVKMRKTMLLFVCITMVFSNALADLSMDIAATHPDFAPADYDGDGKAEFTVVSILPYRDWEIFDWGDTKQMKVVKWGTAHDKLVPADYNGDGKIEIATWTPLTGFWSISTENKSFFGVGADIKLVRWGHWGNWPVPADYDGDGKANIAVWHPFSGKWVISINNEDWEKESKDRLVVQWGKWGDKPVPADYDGDGKFWGRP